MANVKVPSISITLDQTSSSTLYAIWGAPGKKSGRWQKQVKNGKKTKKLIDALAGYTVTWTVEYPTYYTNKKGVRVSKAVSIRENSGDVGPGITSASFSIPSNASKIICVVKPKPKTYKNKNGKETPYFTGVGRGGSWDPKGIPEKGPTPSVVIENGKLKISISGVSNSVSFVKFQIVRDNVKLWKEQSQIPVKSGYGSFEITAEPGHTYKARSRIWGTGYALSDWSDYSENVESSPKALNSLNVSATSSNSVNVRWPSAGDDVQYELQWFSKPKVDDPETFDTTSTISSQTVESNEWNISGLEAGTWYFRIRVVKGQLRSSWYPETDTDVSVTLGKPPAPPTTYTLVSSIKLGEIINFYWVHNSQDGAAQTYGEIELTFKDGSSETGKTERIVKQNTNYGNPDTQDENLSYSLNTGTSHTGTDINTGEEFTITFEHGLSIEWRVRTKGPSNSGESQGWSDWSVVRQVDVWEEPYLNMLATSVLDSWMWDPFNFKNDTIFTAARAPLAPAKDDIFTTLPVGVQLDSGPANQTPVGYSVVVVAKDGYTYVNEFGETVNVHSEEVIYSTFIVTDKHSIVHMLTPFNISFQDGQRYGITATVTMNSGLSYTTNEYVFTVDWEEVDMHPGADIIVDPDELYATIVPYCTNSAIGYDIPDDAEEGDEIEDDDDDSNLVENVRLSVYRKAVDGELVEIYSGLPNDRKTSIVDPHPTLDEVSYRVVAYKMDTGQIKYEDTEPEDVPQSGIVISWNESWFNTPEEMNYGEDNEDTAEMDELEYTGLQLKLPFNVDISESMSPDVSLIQYIGRKRPVGYYGTQLGETSTWKTEIPKELSYENDFWTELMPKPDEVLQLLRRLAVYTGDVYVRESSGRTGYWANVKASFDVNHNTKTIPVSFSITRVEGGA